MPTFKKILRSIKSTLSESESTSETSSRTSQHSRSTCFSRTSSLRPRRRSVHESILTYNQSMEAYPEPPPKPPRGRIQPCNFTKHVEELLKMRPTTSASLQKQESMEIGADKTTHYKRIARKLGKDKSALNQKIEDLNDQLSVYIRNHEKMTTAYIRTSSKLREAQEANQLLAAQNELLLKRLESATRRVAQMERLAAFRSRITPSATSSERSLNIEDNFTSDSDESDLSLGTSFVRQDFKRRPFVLSSQSAALFV
ncbi:hypothetical protein L596_006883 [Steinernema carpocapsae]|uniref:Uncharacterized protein n=1 Tax=Steinernema carpocapsae TaxID=34508 RepID=A0A4U5P872_STECR|nr:hypothetical protein L596_006883 [Steinernema carpocapsae]